MNFDVFTILEIVSVSLIVTVFLYLCSGKILGGLQQTSYKTRRMFTWMRRKDNLVMVSLSLLCFMLILSAAVFALCFSFVGDSAFVSLVPFPIFCLIYFFADRKYALKVRTVRTSRYIRLTCCYIFVLLVFTTAFVFLFDVLAQIINVPFVSLLRYILLGGEVMLIPVFAAIANFLDKLYEEPRNMFYLVKAEKALAASKLIKIGITGSYGKTTVKNILNTLLSEKYRVLMTPSSYNTPLGIARCINRNQLENFDVFLAEMGARHQKDIENLCATVHPDYSVITGICPQHLQSFGTVENIVSAKGEILLGTEKGAVLANDELTVSLYDTSPVETYIAGEEVKVSNVKANKNGTVFDLTIGKDTKTVHTKLLGEHTADNMCVAASLAYMLGFTIDEIVTGLEKVDFIPHRLAPIVEGGVTIIDDSYNANVKGAKAAIDVLTYFGGRKFVVTPGLVELGILEERENKKLGESLVGLDRIILVGDTLVSIVKKGYLAAGGDVDKVTTVATLNDAQGLLKEELQTGDSVLFLNDLPDVFNIV